MKLPAIVGLVVLASLTQVTTVSSAAHPAHAAEEKVAPVARLDIGRAPTSRLARTDRSLLGRSDADLVPVVVKLDHDSVASYRGGIPGYEPTSPALTGRRLSGSPAERSYADYLTKREQRFTELLAKRVPDARVGHRLRTVYGGVALTVPANRIPDLLELDDVVAVQKDELRHTLTDASPEFIGADRIEYGSGRNAGRGVIVGVLDTGAWPEHPSFADLGNLGAPPGQARKCDFGDGFKCNNKLISGQAFLESYLTLHKEETYTTARDSNGHGTHTASTAAGNMLDSAKVFGIERGPVRGVAPGAWISVYKVCGRMGCMASDSAMAVAQAIHDGVDVINFSISGGTDPFADPVEMAFLDAYAAGVFVAASAGNSGPGAGTVNHLAPWVTTVAASTQRRAFSAQLTLDDKTFEGSSITDGIGPAPVVRNGKCLEPAKSGAYLGKIVVCERGGNARVEKGWNVLKGGAVGMILYNPTLQDTETDNHWLPTVHLPDASILDALQPGSTATIGPGKRVDGKADVMAGFSSRGPGGLALKPDVTAPGVQVLAGHTPVPDEISGGPQGERFQAIAGTSMSSPHVAGAAALLTAKRPEWTPGQIKSALMTTALTDVLKEDLVTRADPLDLGAGRIAVDRAIRPGLTVSETAERMLRYADDDLRQAELNLPSINLPVMPGRVTVARTFANDTDRTLTYSVKTDGDAITVDRATLSVPPGGTGTIKVTVASRDNDAKWRFGAVSLAATGFPDLHLPVAYRPTQGRVGLTNTCTPSPVELGQEAKCRVVATNGGYEDATVSVSAGFDKALQPVRPDIARAGVLDGVAPGVPQVSTVDGSRYRRLSVKPDPIGDEGMITYEVPAFTFAGERYERISVVSNGYLVIGGGSRRDVQSSLSDERPRNVLAPYWADLIPDEGVRVAKVQADGRQWIVVDWHAGVHEKEGKARFQVWIATGEREEIRYAYDKVPVEAAVGAENALGQGAISVDRPSRDLVVKSSGFKPGGTLDYTITVRGIAPARDASVTASMTSDGVPGTTVVQARLPVVSP
ncbi:S8 family serine peptidase [Allorhizocola rhizosphaerae]|uniref:S8 family serine peptidase n=1 Tax=Allorhizocola rhizosphaerae TaxID=1872709 RepID=UPI000E3D7FF5|nr:S8 family serine peptidase [Allorhizocola rhizosphaerae]